MNYKKIPVGKNAPEQVNCVVEIARDESAKYEYDEELNAFKLDRVLKSAMRYPANYGFVPSTLAEDGDPLDIMIYVWTPIQMGAVVECDIIGVLEMDDDGEKDWKLVGRPVWAHEQGIKDIHNVNKSFLDMAKNFFQHYKDLEGKVVKIGQWLPKDRAVEIVTECVERYKQNK